MVKKLKAERLKLKAWCPQVFLGVLGGEKAGRCKMDDVIKHPTLCPLHLFPSCALWLKRKPEVRM
ncbi:hypothetical protein OC25_23435 [Pedobacter kyungheensis]|uniref:Uncharacterized protein n=1 Tax=Pedobacter kyungheensis TaxID=1069985 RepID=A0A0C1FDF7_9SPHI|nr:hypothetical protein OC25_23435 [Pedobacter kyungheensis]